MNREIWGFCSYFFTTLERVWQYSSEIHIFGASYGIMLKYKDTIHLRSEFPRTQTVGSTYLGVGQIILNGSLTSVIAWSGYQGICPASHASHVGCPRSTTPPPPNIFYFKFCGL